MTKKICNIKAENGSHFLLERRVTETNGTDDPTTKEQKQIVITVESIENVDPCKANEILVRVEHAGNSLAESEQFSVKSNGKTDIGLEAYISAEDVNPQFVDDILSNPVLFTVINCTCPVPQSVSPASQSSNAENSKKRLLKTPASSMTAPLAGPGNILGVCNLDIGGLIMGKKTTPEEIIPWTKLPRLLVTVRAGQEPIIPNHLMKCSNIVGITVESVYNIPDYIIDGTIFDANIPIPTLGDKNNTLVFPGGLTTAVKDPSCKKKWLNLLHLEGQGGRSENNISPNACDIINTVPNLCDLERELIKAHPVIQWNTWRNSLMLKSDCNYFYSKLMKYRMWPIEICHSNKLIANVISQKSAKSVKKSKPVTSSISANADRFLAFLDISSLLYPGVTNARIAAQLYTYSQTDLVNKFGADLTLAQPSVATVKSKAGLERSRASLREPEESRDAPGVPVFNEMGAPTFVVVEVELFKPFTPKKESEYLHEQLKSHVSLKGKINKKTMNLELAQNNYSNSVKRIVSVLATEYQNFSILLKRKKTQPEDFDVAFHQFLQQQEDYHKVKATLESKILELINEKYGALSQYKERIPEIFAYLVSEMHKVTNCCVVGEEDVSSTHFNTNALELYAEEAMEEGEYCLAKDYKMLKLSRNLKNPDCWLDCAVFFVVLKNYEAAVEAVREALSLDPSHQIGLLMYGLLMTKFNDGCVAELTFQVLLAKHPDFVEGWTVLRLFYYTTNNHEGVQVAQQMAKKMEHQRKLEEESSKEEEEALKDFYCKTYPPANPFALAGEEKFGISSFKKSTSLTDPLSWTTQLCPPDNIKIKTAILMLRLGFYEYASMALAEEMGPDEEPKSQDYIYYNSVSHYLQGRYEEAILQLETFVKEYGKDCAIWSLMGHCLYKLENNANAIACYEYVMESYNRPNDLHLIYLRMGYFYLKAKKYPCAKKIFLTACKYSPSPRLWKGAGVACLRMQEAEDAETAFGEASYLDNKDPEIWAYLTLTNVLLGRLKLFQHCYSEAKKRNLTNQELIQEIESCIISNGLEGEEF